MAFWEIDIYREPSKGFKTLGGYLQAVHFNPFWKSISPKATWKAGRF